MIARVARFGSQPDRFTTGDYQWVLDTIESCSGFVAAYHMVDERTGDSISMSVFDTERAALAAEQQVGIAREKLRRAASPPDEVGFWRVVDSAGR